MANQLRKCEGFGFIREDLDILDKYLLSRGLDLDERAWEHRRDCFNPVENNSDAALLAGLLNLKTDEDSTIAVPATFAHEHDIVVHMRDWRRRVMNAAIRKAKRSL